MQLNREERERVLGSQLNNEKALVVGFQSEDPSLKSPSFLEQQRSCGHEEEPLSERRFELAKHEASSRSWRSIREQETVGSIAGTASRQRRPQNLHQLEGIAGKYKETRHLEAAEVCDLA